jgi:hypothetical protein
VTCHHVLRSFRERRNTEGGLRFQFGPVRVEPDEYLIAEDRDLDLVTLDVSRHFERGIPSTICIAPPAWPPDDIGPDDVLALAGFPGNGRDQLEIDYLRFHAFSAGTTEGLSRGPTHLYTRIALPESLIAGERPNIADDLGGMSGGAVFVWRRGAILTAELVGVIIEYQANLDLMYVRRASCLSIDGGIRG